MNQYRINDIRHLISSRGLLYPLDVALVGATGVGKSSTINGLFGDEVAKVGTVTDPETQEVAQYRINDVFRVHDSAGFGEGKEADARHAHNLSDLLLQTCRTQTPQEHSYGLIDLALVILDGSSRDMGTTYKLLEQVVLQCLEPSRVVVAINQADMAMKGRYWNHTKQRPEAELQRFLEEKSHSIQNRLYEATGIRIPAPIYYSAATGYNLDQLMNHIIQAIPQQRRLSAA